MLIPKTRKEIYQAYLSGETHLELPRPVTRDEIILYNACINGAGTNPSWNDMPDKPFGEEGWSITWDGNTEGREFFEEHLSDQVTAVLYKVSDLYLTAEDLKSATMVVHNASLFNFPERVVIGESDGLSVFEDASGSVSVIGNEVLELVRSTHSGTYVLLADLSYFGMSGFVYATELYGSTIKTVNPKYLPNASEKDIPLVVEQNLPDGRYKQIDGGRQCPPVGRIITVSVEMEGSFSDGTGSSAANHVPAPSSSASAELHLIEASSGVQHRADFDIPLVVNEATGETDVSLSSVAFYRSGAIRINFSGSYTGAATVSGKIVATITISGAYNESAYDCLELWSSTDGSLKKFKITVDDNGTLSATAAT